MCIRDRSIHALAGDVVPGTHHESAVDRDRAHRRMREYIAHRDREFQFVRDGHEVLPVRAQTMQPDDAVLRLLAGLQDYRGRTVSYTHLRAHETVLDLVCR